MKAIFINSKEQSVHEIELSTNQEARMAEMYDRLECRMFEIGQYFNNGDVLFVDEEGLLTATNESMFFSINNNQPLIGNGLILGDEVDLDNGSYTINDHLTKIESLNIKFLNMETIKEILMDIS